MHNMIKSNLSVLKIPMKPSIALQANRTAIRNVVERHRARNARVFGSVLYGQDQEGSDLDLLIDPTPDTTMFDIGAIRHELFLLLGVQVDVLTPNALPDSFRSKVLEEARPV
jgi:predicted nucleotidyltransferase